MPHEKRSRIAAFGFGFCEMTVDNVLLANTVFAKSLRRIIKKEKMPFPKNGRYCNKKSPL